MTSSKNSFSGIWGETTPEMVSIADSLAEEHKEKPVSLKRRPVRKTFGISSIMLTLFLFVMLSLGVTALYSYAADVKNITELTTDPVYVMLSMLTMHVSWIGGAWLTVKAPTVKRFLYRLKFKFRKFDALIGLGYAAFFFGFAAGLSWLLTDILGLDISGAENTSTFTQYEGIWLILFAYLLVSIIGPTVEELFFRGYMMQGVINSLTEIFGNARELRTAIQVTALLITATVFGFFHIQTDAGSVWWVTVLVTGTLGLFMGVISLIHKRLGPAVFAHIFYNCTAITIAITAAGS